jgi:crotonobetainyl-CoA:carnitine CoA-transferase CaiB-like acyl-CoA transferase
MATTLNGSGCIMGDTALADLHVLELTHYIAGPYCTKLLADYGAAEVMRVESLQFSPA